MLSPRLLLAAIVTGWLALSPVVAVAGPTPPAFADDAFQSSWARTDQPIADGVISSTWIWGPAPHSDARWEPYAEAPDGERLVQYFDKSRMEITDPGGDASSPWYVTNGLLVTEMIVGRIQTGDSESVVHFPSETPVAGDPMPRNGPSYATFSSLLDLPADREEWEEPVYVDRVGETVTERIDWTGVIESDPALAEQEVTLAVFDEVTERNIAEPFWDFMTSTRTVVVDGEYVEASLFEDPYFATGRPLTEPYWAEVVVGGTPKLVLVQCFERRCLTYTPDNPEGWQVEAGNVGLHYYAWRYGQTEATGTLLVERDGDLFTVKADGSDLQNLTADIDQAVRDPVWSSDGTQIAFAGEFGRLFVMNADGDQLRQLTEGWLDSAPTWSPDSTSIAFVRWVEGEPGSEQYFDAQSQLFIVDVDGTGERQVADIPPEESFSHTRSPAWSPDGQQIAFVNINDRPGPAPLNSTVYLVRPDGTDLTALVETKGDAQPQWSPDGQRLIYLERGASSRDFTGHRLWTINIDGTGQLQLAGGDATDPRDAVWSPIGDWIAFMQGSGLEETPGWPAGIHLVRPDGSERMQISHFGSWPMWSPDGQHIAFASGHGGIVVMDRSGENLSVVVDGFAPPRWQPVAQ